MTTPIFGYSGLGKTTYANDFPAIAKDMQQGEQQTLDQFMLEVGKTIQSGEYKYVFLPCDEALRVEFVQRKIAFIVVLPDVIPHWVRRWLKAGDSAESIKHRVESYAEIEETFSSDPIIYLYGKDNEWIGNALSQYGNTAHKEKNV